MFSHGMQFSTFLLFSSCKTVSWTTVTAKSEPHGRFSLISLKRETTLPYKRVATELVTCRAAWGQQSSCMRSRGHTALHTECACGICGWSPFCVQNYTARNSTPPNYRVNTTKICIKSKKMLMSCAERTMHCIRNTKNTNTRVPVDPRTNASALWYENRIARRGWSCTHRGAALNHDCG